MELGAYHDLVEVGRGGMGVVYRARGPEGVVAIKLLGAGSRPALERFARERRLHEELGTKEGFVPFLSSGESPAGPFLVMPYLEGGTLRARLEKGPLALDETLRLARILATTLGRAHRAGIVHRDFKPENVLFTAEGEPLVADLGLAKHALSESGTGTVAITLAGELRGTAGYMPAEQMRDARAVDARADVFALGAVIYECLAGRPAFGGETPIEAMVRVEEGKVEPLARVRPDVPRWLAEIVERAVAKDPGSRFEDAGVFGAAIDGGWTRAGRTRAFKVAAVLLSGVVLGVALALLLGREPEVPAVRPEQRETTDAGVSPVPSPSATDPPPQTAKAEPTPVSSEGTGSQRPALASTERQGNVPAELGSDDMKRVDEIIAHSSRIALDDLQAARDDLLGAIKRYPLAGSQLQDAIDLVGFVTEATRFLEDPEAKPEVGSEITARFANFAQKPRGKDQVSRRVMAEIRGWDSALGMVGRLHDYLRGEGPPPPATRAFADARTGVAAGYGAEWSVIASKLIPAVGAFERSDMQEAKRNADAAANVGGALFKRAREAAKYLAGLAEARRVDPRLSAIDALETVQGADTLFASRRVKYDLKSADIPGRQGWDWVFGRGIVAPGFRDKPPAHDSIPLGNLRVGAEVRLKITPGKRGFAMLARTKEPEMLDKVYLLPALVKVALNEDHPRGETDAKPHVFEILVGPQGVRVREGSTTVTLERGAEDILYWIHGRGVTVEEMTFFR
jgi:hypothetical protein